MKQKTTYAFIFLISLLSASCAHHKKKKGSDEASNSATSPNLGKSWDYDKIRQSRDAEKAQKPSDAELKEEADEDANCVVMTKTQMIRSKASGCRPVDARTGAGANSFCCPAK